MAIDNTIDFGFVTLRPRTIAVMQQGELAYVQASGRSYYDARLHEAQTLEYLRMLEIAHMRAQSAVQANSKWCAGCGDTRLRSYFSPDARNRDGLDGHCKQCRNEHRRRMYAQQRADEGREVRAYKRREASVIEVDFGGGVVEKAA